jgi:hypothetical protein
VNCPYYVLLVDSLVWIVISFEWRCSILPAFQFSNCICYFNAMAYCLILNRLHGLVAGSAIV